MKHTLITILFILAFSFSAYAQEETINISRAAAIECDRCTDEKKALELELKTVKEQFQALKIELERERGNTRAENEKAIEKNATIVRLTAIIDRMIPMLRKKKVGFLNVL
jgi:hypothetical protein